VQLVYANMCQKSGLWFIDGAAHDVWAAGHVPLLSWEAQPGDRECASENPTSYPGRIVNSHEFDKYIHDVAQGILEFLNGIDGKWGTSDDRRLYLSLSSEMNGGFRSWYSSPSTFKAMHRKIIKIIRQVIPQDSHTKTRLQIIWTVNNVDVPAKGKKVIKAEKFYPGSAYVDWIGLDGYNWAGFKYSAVTPAQCFSSMISRLHKLAKKPLGIVEVSCASKSSTVAKKNKWLAQVIKYLASKKVKMVNFFNEDKSSVNEADWDVFTTSGKGDKTTVINGRTYHYYSGWALGMKSSFFVGSSTKNPRLISDSAFLGK